MPKAVDTLAANRQLKNLDLAKFACALLVVAIHAAPFQGRSELANFYITNVLARFAVPLFFAISGFLFFRKLTWENGKIKNCRENKVRLVAYIKRIGLLYAAWAVFYTVIRLPEWYQTGWWGPYVIKDVAVAFFVRGSHYHLWYLLATAYAVPVLYLLLSWFPKKCVSILACVLWIFECLVYSYAWIGVDRFALVSFISEKFPIVFDTMFRAVPLMMVGVQCMDSKQAQNKKKLLGTAAAAMLLWIVEASLLFFLVSRDGKYSYLLSSPFFAYAALRLLTRGRQVQLSSHSAAVMRNMSLTIYCLHPLIRNLCEYVHVPLGIPLWLATTAITTGIAYLWAKMKIK